MRMTLKPSPLTGWLAGFASASLVAIVLVATAGRPLAAVNPGSQQAPLTMPPTLQSLAAQIATLQGQVANLNAQVTKLQSQVGVINDLKKSYCGHIHIIDGDRHYGNIGSTPPTNETGLYFQSKPSTSAAVPTVCL